MGEMQYLYRRMGTMIKARKYRVMANPAAHTARSRPLAPGGPPGNGKIHIPHLSNQEERNFWPKLHAVGFDRTLAVCNGESGKQRHKLLLDSNEGYLPQHGCAFGHNNNIRALRQHSLMQTKNLAQYPLHTVTHNRTTGFAGYGKAKPPRPGIFPHAHKQHKPLCIITTACIVTTKKLRPPKNAVGGPKG